MVKTKDMGMPGASNVDADKDKLRGGGGVILKKGMGDIMESHLPITINLKLPFNCFSFLVNCCC